MHPQIKTFLEIAGREELDLNIETNGIVCTPELAAEIAELHHPFVSVSLDGGNAATHDWVRGIQGSFELAVRGICNLAEVGIRPQVVMSIMRCNADQLEALVRLAETLGASSVRFNIVQPTGRGEMIHEGTNGLEIAELIALGRLVEHELAARTDLALHFGHPLAFRSLSRIASGDRNVCGILGILGVIPSGHYALCGIAEHRSELVFGKAGHDPLERVWQQNPILNRLREALPGRLAGVCGNCLMKHQCLGSCIAQNYYRSGDLLAPFWFCQQADAQGMFPKSRLVLS
jgi:SynChlorMet cassette radical SAM/SPASM protein ScmF